MPDWNTSDAGEARESRFSTSYGEQMGSDVNTGGWDGKSCADFHQLAGRGIAGVEDMTMLDGLSDVDPEDKP